MARKGDHRKTCIYLFSQDLTHYGHVSLLTLATWNSNIPKKENRDIQVKKTYNLLDHSPKTKKSE